MSTSHLVRFRIALLWSLLSFGAYVITTTLLNQRTLLIVLLFAIIIGSSTMMSRAIITTSAKETILYAPPARLVAHITPKSDEPSLFALNKSQAQLLADAYRLRLADHTNNQQLLSNLILLSSALNQESDTKKFLQQRENTDRILSCSFSNSSAGLLQINCPPLNP